MARIDTDTLRSAVRAIDDLYAELRVIGIDGALARSAGELAELHGRPTLRLIRGKPKAIDLL